MSAETSPAPQRRSSPWPWIIGGLIVGVAVIGALVAVLNPTPPPDPATPEGTPQAFLQAIDDQQYDTAYDLLHADVQGSCTAQDLVTSEPVPRTVVTNTVTNGNEATVFVRMTFNGDPVGGSYKSEGLFELADDGGWAITSFPWPYTACFYSR